MTDQKAQPRFSIAVDNVQANKSEAQALEFKIAELTAIAESLSQRIAISQGQVERMERQVEDLRRLKQQAETDLQAQEQLGTDKRREIYRLEMEIQKNAANISGQQERARTLNETVEIAEKRGKQTIDTIQADTELKLKGIRHEFDLERERITIDLSSHRSQVQAEMKQVTDEWEQIRKKQLRTLEIEAQDARKKTDETVAKLLQEGRSKNEALIRATEATALEVHRESESAAKRLLIEANQKAADAVRAAQLDAEEVRRRTHNAEVSFLKEKNSGLAELKLMVNSAKEEAQGILAAANKAATEIHYKTEQDNEAKIAGINAKINAARQAAEKEIREHYEKSQAEMHRQAQDQAALLARKVKEAEDQVAGERKRMEDESRIVLSSARERAQAIIETANNEKTYKFEELKALESSMFQSARQSASAITHEAETIALGIVEEARGRARTVEKGVEAILDRANEDAGHIRESANNYAQKIKQEVPDPTLWESELARIRQQEQDRLQALIEPTIMNYLKAIDMTITDIFVGLPSKYQTNKVIHDFAQAIANIQARKTQIKFGDLIPRQQTMVGQQPTSHPPIKKTS